MKIFFILILSGLLFAGCGDETKTDLPAADPAADAEASIAQIYTAASENLVRQFGAAMQEELMSALAASGPAHALQVCQLNAPGIEVAHGFDGWTIKRVSEKWRNVKNRPDTTELAILRKFEAATAQDNYLTSWSGPDSARVFNYYKKIMIRRVCLQCHGDLQTVDMDLWRKVKVAYPWDKATGYKEGDLRGMFVVAAEYPAGEEMARLLADGVKITALTAPDSVASDTTASDSATAEPGHEGHNH